LQSSIELLKCKIVDLFVKVQTQVVILNRLHAICDLLRKIMRTQSLTLQTLDKENVMSPHSMLEISMYKCNLFNIFFNVLYLLKIVVNTFNENIF